MLLINFVLTVVFYSFVLKLWIVYFKLMGKNFVPIMKSLFGYKTQLDKLLDEIFYDYNDNKKIN